MIAYTVAQLLKYATPGEIEIVIVNNYPQDIETVKYLQPFIDSITFINYPENRLQSHGISLDWLIDSGYVKTEYFLMLESDAFPIKEFIPYYQRLIDENFDAALSMLKLSGGLYGHPCGGLYKTSVYKECKEYCNSIEYSYFPNMNRRGSFDFHTMIHNSIVDKILESPENYFELAEGYKPYLKEKAIEKRDYYKPTCGVFHNGMGNNDEDLATYGQRGFDTGIYDVMLTNKKKIVRRVGLEPGQFFSWWMAANNKKLFSIPTIVKWMNGREGQQQEYTENEAGIHHIWGISSYTERVADGVEDIYEAKRSLPDELYKSLPDHQKIKL